MALDRLLTAYPTLTAATARTGGVKLWARRQLQTQLISTGQQTGIYDLSNLLARESTVFRMRFRSDITLRTVLVDDEDYIWFLESIGEVGRRRFLDVAATNYQGVAVGDDIAEWPIVTDPYTPQASWGLVDSDNNPVQNITIRQWYVGANGDIHDQLFIGPTSSVRSGWYVAGIHVVNDNYTSTDLPRGGTTGQGRRLRVMSGTGHVVVESRNGLRGRMATQLSLRTSPNVQVGDGWIPLIEGFFVNFDGTSDPGLRIGATLRVLSMQELQ